MHSIGEWEICQKRYYGSCPFFVLQPKIHNLYSSTRVIGMSTREKELGITQGYLCIFGPHNRF